MDETSGTNVLPGMYILLDSQDFESTKSNEYLSVMSNCSR